MIGLLGNTTLVRTAAPPLGNAVPAPPAEETAPPAPIDKPIKFEIDPTAPHPRLIIPADKKPVARPVSGSVVMRNIIGGTVFGATTGTYVAVTMLTAYPMATAAVIMGSAASGALLGYFLSK